MLKTRALLLFALLFVSPLSATAGYEWGFANVSLNRLFWDSATKRKSTKTNFNYLELEGGAQFTWGELYGFFDLENFLEIGELQRTATKGVIRAYLGKSGFSLYGHVYNFAQQGFSEQNRVYGLGYQVSGPGWWVKPFLGFHDVTQTYFSGANGFMGGWVIGYTFKLGKQDFLAANWHELEFDRKHDYAFANGDRATSQNGAISLWWTATPVIMLGAQWRYAMDKLGTPGFMHAGILSAKYVF